MRKIYGLCDGWNIPSHVARAETVKVLTAETQLTLCPTCKAAFDLDHNDTPLSDEEMRKIIAAQENPDLLTEFDAMMARIEEYKLDNAAAIFMPSLITEPMAPPKPGQLVEAKDDYICAGWGVDKHSADEVTIVDSLGRQLHLCRFCKAEFDLEYPTLVEPDDLLVNAKVTLGHMAEGHMVYLHADEAKAVLDALVNIEAVKGFLKLESLPAGYDLDAYLKITLEKIVSVMGMPEKFF